MAAGDQRFDYAQRDHGQQAEDEQIGWDKEDAASFADAPQIYQRYHNQNCQAHSQRMPLQPGHSGNQCTHAGRNTHRRCQDVIHHQGSCGQQSRPYAKVFTGDRVRSAALRIRHDGLSVGKVYDGEQADDTDADGNDVSHPSHSQGNQDRQRRFRPVGSGAERIQAEDGHTFGGADPLSLLFLGREWSAQQQIDEIHGSIFHRTCVPRWGQTVPNRS